MGEIAHFIRAIDNTNNMLYASVALPVTLLSLRLDAGPLVMSTNITGSGQLGSDADRP